MGRSVAKSLIDYGLGFVGLVAMSPIFFATAVLVRIKLGSPVFFTQERPGLNGRPFRLYKFRTMTDACDEDGNFLDDEARLTPFGRWLRRVSLDELPQLINVVKGELSLVGPRPLLMEYVPLYSPNQARRHEVKPGITGWAQVNGRNAISWQEKFDLDVWYVDNQSVRLDVRILWLTLVKVVKREGIGQEGRETMERFRGGTS